MVLIWRPMPPRKMQTGTVFAAPTRARSTPCGCQGWGERETHPSSRPQMALDLLSCSGSRRVTSLLGSVSSGNCEVEMRTRAKCVNCDTHRCITATHLPSSCLLSLVTCQVIVRGVAKGRRHIWGVHAVHGDPCFFGGGTVERWRGYGFGCVTFSK